MHPLFEIVLPLLFGGVVSFAVRSAPFVDPAFKPYVTWIVAVGSIWVALSRSGTLMALR